MLPGMQATLHPPFAQTWPVGHVSPALPCPPAPQPGVAPQKSELVLGSMHVPLQTTCDGSPHGHSHPSDPQIAPGGQEGLQGPSHPFEGTTHRPPHRIMPVAHLVSQTPALQSCPLVHALSHVPQFKLSLCVLVQ